MKYTSKKLKARSLFDNRWVSIPTLIIVFATLAVISICKGSEEATTFAAFIIAAIACYMAIKSYEWSTKTTRPFLCKLGNIGVGRDEVDKIALTFPLINTGTLPSSNAIANIEFFTDNELITENNLSTVYAPTNETPVYATIFPNAPQQKVITFNLKKENDAKLWQDIQQGKVRARIRIDYEGPHKNHITIDTILFTPIEGKTGLFAKPTKPQKWTQGPISTPKHY